MKLDPEVLQQIRRLVRGGFATRDRVMQILCEEAYAPGELDEHEVSAAVDVAFQELHSEAANWPGITDCDRLEAAFAAMSARGIIALQNAGYTQSDGYSDVLHYAESHPSRSQLIGYCFYHGQDLERAVDGGGLYLAFGPIDPAQEQSAGPAVGRAIVEELDRAGLRAEWDGTFDKRISIPTLDWKHRVGEGAVAEIAAGVREAIAGGDKLCATFVIAGDEDRWLQFVGSVVNAAYPHRQDPEDLIARIGNAVVESSEAGKYVTARLEITHVLGIARWIDTYFKEVLGADSDYSVDLDLQWL